MSAKKEHGAHNEVLCDHILQKGSHNDWAITTAFYSAIHYIDHKIFPLVLQGQTVSNIEQANNILKKPSRHSAREVLVTQFLSCQTANYAFLDKSCRNARYRNYKVSKDKAKIVRARLSQIITKCCESEAAKTAS